MAMTMSIGVEFTMKDSFSGPATKIATAFNSLKSSVAGLPAVAGQFNGFSTGIAAGVNRMARGSGGGGGGGGGGGVRPTGGGGGGGGLAGLQGMIGGVSAAFFALKGVTSTFHAFDSLTGAAGKFGQGLASARAVMRASVEDMGKLEKAAIKAGLDTKFNPTEAVAGLELLGQSGFNANQAISLLNPTLDLAAGGQISVAQAASTTSAAIKVFGLSMDQAALATDKMLRISNATSLTAADLELGLANVSRGATVTGQSIDEMLLAMGLVKNTGTDVSVASSAVSSALLSMAKNAGKFKSDLGVEVTDAAGQFRPLMDIIFDSDQALKTIPNAAERSAKAMELFGKFGLTAFAGISQQLKSGVTLKDTLYQSEDAISELRKTMATAGGAAATFKSQLLDTFEGQQTLLRGSVETLMIVVGKPLTQALRPMVEMAINGINRLITFVQSMPESAKVAMAKFAIVLSVLGSVGAAAMAVGVAIATIGPHVATVVSAVAGAWPIVLALAAAFTTAGLGAAAMKVGIENDLGGVGTYLTKVFGDAKLAVDALFQLFSSGAVSGDAATALMDPANEGVLGFVTNVYLAVNRIDSFLSGIGKGFTAAVKELEPVFSDFRSALEGLSAEFGGLSTAMDPGDATSAFDAAGKSGEGIGKSLGQAGAIVVRVLTFMLDMGTAVAAKWGSISTALSPIGEALGGIGDVLGQITGEFSSASEGGKSLADVGAFIVQGFANVLTAVGHIMGSVGSMFRGVVNVVMGVINILDGLFHGRWGQMWKGVGQVVYGVVTAIIGSVLGMVQAVVSGIDSLAAAFGYDLGLADFIGNFKKTLDSEFKFALGVAERPMEPPPEDQLFGTTASTLEGISVPDDQLFGTTDSANSQTSSSPAVSQVEVSSAGNEALASSVDALGGKIDGLAKRPVTVRSQVDLNVDGNTIASVVTDANASSDDLSYGPTG